MFGAWLIASEKYIKLSWRSACAHPFKCGLSANSACYSGFFDYFRMRFWMKNMLTQIYRVVIIKQQCGPRVGKYISEWCAQSKTWNKARRPWTCIKKIVISLKPWKREVIIAKRIAVYVIFIFISRQRQTSQLNTTGKLNTNIWIVYCNRALTRA